MDLFTHGAYLPRLLGFANAPAIMSHREGLMDEFVAVWISEEDS